MTGRQATKNETVEELIALRRTGKFFSNGTSRTASRWTPLDYSVDEQFCEIVAMAHSMTLRYYARSRI